MKTRSLALMLALLAAALPPAAGAADEAAEDARNKSDAVDRVAKAHDETMIAGTAALIVKQASVRVARQLLDTWGREAGLGKGWKQGEPEWKAAEALLVGTTTPAVIARAFEGGWVKEIRREYVGTAFDGESADTIATHLESKSGQAQIAMMDWFMGEMTLFNYTYTGRFEYDLVGAEAELKALQKAAQPRIPKKDNELEFSTLNPEAFQFVACSPENRYCVGPRYAKLNAVPIQGAIIRRIDAMAAEVQTAMKSMRPQVQPHLDAWRARQ